MAVRTLLLLAAAACLCSAPPAAAGNVQRLQQHALELVNEARTGQGLPALTLETDLGEAAQAHAKDMAERRYYSHESPEGGTVADRYRDAGGSRWRQVAENIAHCPDCEAPPDRDDVERLHRGWMESPGHRKNILDPGSNRFGFGLAVFGEGGLYAVQTFAGPGSSRTAAPGDPIDVADQTAGALELINAKRRENGVPPLQADEALAAAARKLLPDTGDLTLRGGLANALPKDERRAWGSLSIVAGACGGCGTEPEAADLAYFRDSWFDDPQYRDTLLAPGFTHLGFSLKADGDGRKAAAALLGERR